MSGAAGDAVADTLDSAELLDIDVDQFARPLPLVAPHRLGRLQVTQPAEPQAAQDAADGGGRDAELRGDRLAGLALAPQALDPRHHRRRRRPAQTMRPRRAVLQPSLRLPRASAPPICARSWRRARRPWPRPSGSALAPPRDAPVRLDYAASGGHSYGCPFGPPGISEASATSASSARAEWTTYESSQLAARGRGRSRRRAARGVRQ